MSEVGVQRDTAIPEPAAPIDRSSGRRRGDRIVGAGRATQEVVELAIGAARSERPVWISGPHGAGKDHLARAVHAWSARSSGPYVAFSCSAFTEAQLGRELFGAASSDDGALSRAAGGTLLVDAVERLPDALRALLARALAEARYVRDGESSPLPLRARVIATTAKALDRSPFGDLPQHQIRLLPLSERPEDILPLAAHFLRLHADEEGVTPVGFTADARSALVSEPWPGNVRELGERVRQAVRLARDGAITAEALLLAAEDLEAVPSFKEAKRAFETRYVVGLLRRCGGNISRAARLAKKDRKDFYDVIRRTGIDPTDFR
jgi:two-component system response regulator GlrR